MRIKALGPLALEAALALLANAVFALLELQSMSAWSSLVRTPVASGVAYFLIRGLALTLLSVVVGLVAVRLFPMQRFTLSILVGAPWLAYEPLFLFTALLAVPLGLCIAVVVSKCSPAISAA